MHRERQKMPRSIWIVLPLSSNQRAANLDKALRIALDSKLQYPAACNAMENLLIHQELAPVIIPQWVKKFKENGVILLGCKNTYKITNEVSLASDNEWDEEYNDLKLSIKIVENFS